MHGGRRVGAGRKKKSSSQKKLNRNIYLSEDLYNAIMEFDDKESKSFSQKCVKLIELGMKKMTEETKNEFEDIINEEYSMIDNKKNTITKKKITMKNKKNERSLDFIDLFAGIGGIRKGFEDENTRAVFSSEWDKFAVQTYTANYGDVPHGDITEIHEDDIPNHDVLLAGFPCQPFSQIGKQEGFGHETQGTLFFDVLRILNKKRPKMFLLENVKGLLTNDKGNTFKVILENLEELGYSVFYDVLDAQNFGLPQRRQRVLIVGFRPDLGIDSFAFPQGHMDVRVPVKSVLEKNPEGYTISEKLQENYLFKKDDGKPQIVDFESDIQVNTLVASYHKIQRLTGTFVKDGETGLRLLSELEVKRIMGFPDDFIVPVSRTQMYRQFGNSVAVPMVKAVADAMKEELFLAEKRLQENHEEVKKVV